jgi:hypothetical protein
VCDEHGIGNGGEYRGGNDAQLGRINVFYCHVPVALLWVPSL